MLPCNQDPLYDIFYVDVPYLQKVTKVVISYNTGIIVAAGVIIVWYILYCCDSTSVWWVLDHLSWLGIFISGCLLYAMNNCGNKSVLFGVNFVCGDWSSCIGGFPFLTTPFIYRLFSISIFQYMLFSIAAESQPLFFRMPHGGIAYVNPIFTLISVSFALSSAASLTTPTAASSAFKSVASYLYLSSPIWFYLPSLSIPSWWYLGGCETLWYNCWYICGSCLESSTLAISADINLIFHIVVWKIDVIQELPDLVLLI